MAVNAVMYQVAIASPSDVPEERIMIRKVIHDWNSAHSRAKRAILLPLGWETDVAPAMGGSAQGHISKQIIDDADLLIAVFWTRLGTPTDGAESGTVKEIKEFLAAGKLVMLYHNTQPALKSENDQAQFDALQEFVKWCQGNGKISQYVGIQDFKDRLTRDLANHLSNHAHFQRSVPEGASLEASGTAGDLISEETAPRLTAEASELLLAATKDSSGSIIVAQEMGGKIVQVNGKNYIPKDPRGAAIWWAALQELENFDLIRAVGPKREIFEVTREGYSFADRLEVRPKE